MAKNLSKYIEDSDFLALAEKVRTQYEPTPDMIDDKDRMQEMVMWVDNELRDWEDSRSDELNDGWLGLSYAAHIALSNDIVEYAVKNFK